MKERNHIDYTLDKLHRQHIVSSADDAEVQEWLGQMSEDLSPWIARHLEKRKRITRVMVLLSAVCVTAASVLILNHSISHPNQWAQADVTVRYSAGADPAEMLQLTQDIYDMI